MIPAIRVSAVSRERWASIDLAKWLQAAEPEWFLGFMARDEEAEANFLLHRFGWLAERDDVTLLTAESDGDVLAITAMERMAWDSRHFSCEIARLAPCCIKAGLDRDLLRAVHKAVLDEAVAAAHRQGIRMLQRRLLSARMDEIQMLEAAGFRMVDNVVTLTANTEQVGESSAGIVFRELRSDDVPDLKAMMHGSFPHSRFVYDSLLTSAGEEVYLNWLESAAAATAGEGGGFIIATWHGGDPVGFVSWSHDPEMARYFRSPSAEIELFAVESKARGRGVGKALLQEARRRMAQAGIVLVEASTWINQKNAMNTYQRSGFCVRENLLTFHFHL